MTPRTGRTVVRFRRPAPGVGAARGRRGGAEEAGPPPGPRRWWTLPWRIVRALLLLLAAFWFLIEEVGWRPLARWVGRLGAWGPWARAEARIARLPPRPALSLFLLPVLLLLPVKLLALGLMHDGHPVAGVIVIIAAKLVGTAIGGRLFVLMRRTLMQIRRFARAMAWWRLTRRRARRTLQAALDWRTLRSRLRRWRRRVGRGFRTLRRRGLRPNGRSLRRRSARAARAAPPTAPR